MIRVVKDLADARCQRLAAKQYTADPGLSEFAAKISASVRSFHAGDAEVLAQSIVEALKTAPHLTVYGERQLYLPDKAFRFVINGRQPTGARLAYTGAGRRRMIDLVVYDDRTKKINFYDVKRGTDAIGADTRRQRLVDDAVLRLIGVDYARRMLDLQAQNADAGVLSYYGLTGLPPEDTLAGVEMDRAFGWPVQAVVEEHLRYFRQICERSMPGLTAEPRA